MTLDKIQANDESRCKLFPPKLKDQRIGGAWKNKLAASTKNHLFQKANKQKYDTRSVLQKRCVCNRNPLFEENVL